MGKSLIPTLFSSLITNNPSLWLTQTSKIWLITRPSIFLKNISSPPV